MLIVDDEEMIHSITNTTLRTMNFHNFSVEVISAYSAEDAKEILYNL